MSFLTSSNADDELLRELLEEERRVEEERVKDSGYQYSEDYVQQQQRTMKNEEEIRREQEEQLMEEQHERLRQQREKDFEASLARMNDEQQEAARKQKKKDARIIRKVMRASHSGNHYCVLGLFNFEWKIGPFKIFQYQLGPFTLFQPSVKDIKKAYRDRAMKTHPDKNRDGRAQEAFIAVEESAAVLIDKEAREQFDLELKIARIARRDRIVRVVLKVVNIVQQQISRFSWLFQKILGPFALPIVILSCLLI